MSVLVEIRKLSKVYERGREKIEVLHHVDLDIEQGDFLALMGPSGSGKTTLLNLIGGLDSPTEGTLTIAGKRIDDLGEGALAKWRASNVGFVFQFYNLLPMLSARKNVELPLLLTRLGAAQRKRNAGIALDLVGLSERSAHKPSELSGGQQQRVAIARAIVSDPDAVGLRRADGRPRSAVGRGDPGPAATVESRSRQNHHHGDARSESRGARPSRVAPG